MHRTPLHADWRLGVRVGLLGFLVNCKPSEPFLTDYLVRNKNLTEAELAVDVYPWSTFGAFVLMLPSGLLAEMIGSRAVIFVGLICREITRALLIWATTVPAMALMQCMYAAGVAADAIYFAYVYQVAPPAQYGPITAIVLASYHAGNVVGATAAQTVVWAAPSVAENLTPLFFLSFGFVSLTPCRRAESSR